MDRSDFEQYHDIASTTKQRGKGIGFAGVGVKLSLLIADVVVTETKRGRETFASRWKLESPERAPWDFIPPLGLVSSESGTAVRIHLKDPHSELLRESFIVRALETHFYPLLDVDFLNGILNQCYKRGVRMLVNGKVLQPSISSAGIRKTFYVVLKGKAVGVGIIRKVAGELLEEQRGMAISTYGKVIKRGWDWLGIAPRNPNIISGIVEVPDLARILTTNKADFLRDTNSLQVYYKYRKAIQEAVEQELRKLGESVEQKEAKEKGLEALEKEIERVLDSVLPKFPELGPLFGRKRKGDPVKGVIPDPNADPVGVLVDGANTMTGTKGGNTKGEGLDVAPGNQPGQNIRPDANLVEKGQEHEGRIKKAGVSFGFESAGTDGGLARLSENTIWINQDHPAYAKVSRDVAALRNYIAFCVAWILAQYLEEGKSPVDFIDNFLAQWGQS